jgi:hypothetical protein
MKVTVQSIIIDRDMVLKPSKRVWAWEVPVLQEKYGDGRVRLLDAVEKEVSGLPDAASEFQRLVMTHGSDGSDGGTRMSYAEMAYGRGKAGLKALQDEIDGCIVGATKAKPKKKVAAKKVKPEPEPVLADDGDGDPLADL